MLFTGSVPTLLSVQVLSYKISESCASIETKRLELLRAFAIPSGKKRASIQEQGQKGQSNCNRGESPSLGRVLGIYVVKR